MPLNYLDIAFVVIFLLFALRGGLRGFLEEIAGLVGLAAGIWLAFKFSIQVGDMLTAYIAPRAAPTVAFVLVFLGGMLVVGIAARLLRLTLKIAFAGWLDHLLGVAVGLLKGFLLCAVVAYAAAFFIPHFTTVRESIAYPYILDCVRESISYFNLALPQPD